jgi:uncharacterized protein
LPESSIRAFADNTADPKIRGFLHTPAGSNGNALVLTHGAGSNANAPLLVALAEIFCAAGFTALRCDLLYRQVRSFGPPGPGDAARDRAGIKNAIAAIGKVLSGDFQKTQGAPNAVSVGREKRIFLGGHSYGGRQCSMLCAELAEEASRLVAGLLLLSYPLHPPGKPEQQRTQHLPNLRTPTLFVQGTRDPFGTIAELEQALKMIPAETKLLPIEGAGHDLGFKGKAKREELPRQIFSEFSQFFGLSS